MVRGVGIAATLAAALVVGVAALLAESRSGGETAESVTPPCEDAILEDWADGAIDETYQPDCYLAAIDSLPEDVRTYTSAEDDITRAMQTRVGGGSDGSGGGGVAAPSSDRQLSAVVPEEALREDVEPASPGSLRLPPAPLLVMAGLGLVVLTGVFAVTAARRIRRGG